MNSKIIFDKKVLNNKKAVLDNAKVSLKSYFIGIDRIIDELIDCISVWYLMPELLKRPVIINLWGMTGVGKTDLVRRLVKLLDFQDRFTEVELSNNSSTYWNTSVSSVLTDNELNDEKPAIVLFDEIQRFNTIDTDGKPVQSTKFTDFWELLSDGKLSKKQKEDLDGYLYDIAMRKKNRERQIAKDPNYEEDRYYLGSWEASRLKKSLNYDGSLEEMYDMGEEEVMSLILKAKKKKAIYEPVNHSRTLIIISGNLDDAYKMSGQVSEADVDADIFSAFTSKISIMNIKEALFRLFRPEQVARFGNIHILYPSLNKADFRKLIAREVDRVKSETFENTGVKIEIDESINELIYANGVFPVQGVRPVYSSVTDILEVNISKYLLQALVNDKDNITISYNKLAQQLIVKIGDETINQPYVGRIDKAREGNTLDATYNISGHESGHAIVYMVLFGLIPLQLKSKLASNYAGGFTFPHQIHETKKSMIDMIKVYLAGGIAEELLFGSDNASTGREDDRRRATIIATDYIRRYGFDADFTANYSIEDYPYRMNFETTDENIEKTLAKLSQETRDLLNSNFVVLKKLTQELVINGNITPNNIQKIANEYGINAQIKPEGYLHISQYSEILDNIN